MKENDKKRLMIEKLRDERDYLMFEYNQINFIEFSVILGLIAIYIPIIIILKQNVIYIFGLLIFFLISIFIIHAISKNISSKNYEKIKCNNCERNKLYDELLK